MRISHEAIYQALYLYTRARRALRVPRARARAKAWAHVSEEVMISSRPAEALDEYLKSV